MGTNLLVTAIVIVYLLFMLWIGWYSSTKITSNTDFMVAGRRLGPFLMAGTLAATEIGGGSSLGVVQNGMSGFGLSASAGRTDRRTVYRIRSDSLYHVKH